MRSPELHEILLLLKELGLQSSCGALVATPRVWAAAEPNVVVNELILSDITLGLAQ